MCGALRVTVHSGVAYYLVELLVRLLFVYMYTRKTFYMHMQVVVVHAELMR